MSHSCLTHTLANGLTLVAEPLPEKQAAAFTLLIPAGSANEGEGQGGLTSLQESLCYCGAGPFDSKALSDALDNAGISRSGGAGVEYTTFGAATLGAYLPDALRLYAEITLRPTFPEGELAGQRDLALQAIQSLQDAPARLTSSLLREQFFVSGHRRSVLGSTEEVRALDIETLRGDYFQRFGPNGAILALSGNIAWEAVVALAEELWGDWSAPGTSRELARIAPAPVYRHLEQDTAQQYIALAYEGVPLSDADYYNYRVAMAILSGGMGARLFTEVREKRGLVYSVSASGNAHRGVGFTIASAGTTPERSQETLDVLWAELGRMAEGVTQAELERAQTGILSGLVMQEESSRSRAAGLARDMFLLGRVRSLDEIAAAVNSVTPASILEFYERRPLQDFSLATVGPCNLKVPGAT